jgi:hypothetical protein
MPFPAREQETGFLPNIDASEASIQEIKKKTNKIKSPLSR